MAEKIKKRKGERDGAVALILRFDDELKMMEWVGQAQSERSLPDWDVRERDSLQNIGRDYILSRDGFAPALEVVETTTTVLTAKERKEVAVK